MYKMGSKEAYKRFMKAEPTGTTQKEILEMIARGEVAPIGTARFSVEQAKNLPFAEWLTQYALVKDKKVQSDTIRKIHWNPEVNLRWYKIKKAFDMWRATEELKEFEQLSGRMVLLQTKKLKKGK